MKGFLSCCIPDSRAMQCVHGSKGEESPRGDIEGKNDKGAQYYGSAIGFRFRKGTPVCSFLVPVCVRRYDARSQSDPGGGDEHSDDSAGEESATSTRLHGDGSGRKGRFP